MKSLLLTAALLCSALAGYSATALKVSLADGRAPEFLLSQKPSVTFQGDQMTIAAPKASVSFNRSDVLAMHFAETSGVEAAALANTFSFAGNTITCQGSPISVFNLAGVCVATGSDCLSLADLAAGLYIVRTNSHSVKITIR